MELAQGDIFLRRYEISHAIGRGAFATVYKGRDLRSDRDVAVKFLHLDDPVARARFEVEAQVIARLSHPATVRVFDYGNCEGTPFMVLDYVAGRTLRDMLMWKGAFPVDRAVNILLQILGSVEEAHQQGIIHRDLKPENIFVSQPDPSQAVDRVRVLDFGVAKVQHAHGSKGTARLTIQGTVVGTLRFMSPEQLRSEEVGPATDLFSIGIIAYEMLVGRHPFHGEPEMTISSRIRSPEAIRLPPLADVPDDLAAIVNTLLQKNVRNRYRSATPVIEDLQMLEGTTTEIPLEGRPTFLRTGHYPADESARSYVSLFDSTAESDD